MNQAIDRLNLMQKEGKITETYVAEEFGSGIEIVESEFWTTDMLSMEREFCNFMTHKGHLILN